MQNLEIYISMDALYLEIDNISIHTYMCVSTCIYMYTCLDVSTRIDIDMSIHACTHTYRHTYVYLRV